MLMVSRTLVLASSMLVIGAVGAGAEEYRCLKEDSSLRIAIEVKKAGHTLPCEVIAEDDRGERAVLYSARYDRAYCPARIAETRDELEQEGWRCEQTSDQNIVSNDRDSPGEVDDVASNAYAALESVESAGAPALRNGKAVLATHQCRRGNDLRSIQIEVEDPKRRKPCELVYWDDGDRSKEGKVLWRAVHDADFCPTRLGVIVGKWSEEGWACDTADLPQEAALAPAPSPASPSRPAEPAAPSEEKTAAVDATSNVAPDLQAIVEADAERIGEWMEVDPAIEIAAHGDLNDDGSDDAVVFMAYQSDQSAYRQYLMSYLVADDGYELASVKLLTGVNAPPANARVQQIEKGVIWLTIPGEDGSASAPTGFRLRNQQLIEVEDTPPQKTAGD